MATITAADIMTSPVITVPPDMGAVEIVVLLSNRKISAVPVCDADGTLVGMVSEGDILRPLTKSATAQREWWLGALAEGEELAAAFIEYCRRDRRNARDMMARDVVTATPEAAMGELAGLMIQHQVKRIPILRGGRVVGIVSRADLIGALARQPAALA